jgi:hypothetical protein
MRAHAKKVLTIVIAMLSLTACATPTALAPGTPEAEVLRRFGRPAEVYALPAPAQARRLAYPIGLHYQQTWMVDIDAQGRVLRVEEAINAAHFAKVRIGQDDTSVIRREFGPPRVIHFYALSGLTAWMYPYLEDLAWNSEMAIYFDQAGIVRRVESGPDPRFLGGSDNRND